METIHVFFSSAIVAVIGWLFSIEPRLQVSKTETQNLKNTIAVSLQQINDRLTSIEESLRNGYHRHDNQ